MRITVIGTGYVGLVSGTCLADAGHEVICVDREAGKIDALRAGEVPIYEPGLPELIEKNTSRGRLVFTTNLPNALRNADVVMICVGTPPRKDGSADLSAVMAAAKQIARNVVRPVVVINRSTSPVGTGDELEALLATHSRVPCSVVSNPEFLREGSAVGDFLQPDRVVVGVEDEHTEATMRILYKPIVDDERPLVVVRRREAEMVKYAANCLLAARISFINEIANICGVLNVDVNAVREGMGYDKRIGFQFLAPGCGYGGSCFPKDVQALAHLAESNGVTSPILRATHTANERQKRILLAPLRDRLDGSLNGRKIAVWGTAFKENTDDVRESPALAMISELLAAGAEVSAHDPQALQNTWDEIGGCIAYVTDPEECAKDADALLIMTPWEHYDEELLLSSVSRMRRPLVLDGRNLFDPDRLATHGIEYHGIGRYAAALTPVFNRPTIRRAKTLLGWRPRVDLQVGLTATIQDFRQRLAADARCADTRACA